MIKLYKANREVQLQWMRKNPGKTVAINVIFAVVFIAVIWLEDKWQGRKYEKEIADQD